MEGSAAQAGFYYQNNVAALKILEALFFNTDVQYIRVDNYQQGPHIDDIIVYRTGLTEYYQVKWSEDSENAYTLYNLLQSDNGKKSIFRQLADGYKKVAGNSTDFTITLFTTRRESIQKRPGEGLPYSLPEIRTNIIEQAQKVNSRYDALPNYAWYQDTVERIRQECNLEPDAFDAFVKKLYFKFSQKPVEQIRQATKFRLESLGLEVGLLSTLLDGVVQWSITGEAVTKTTVLSWLGITDRFDDKLSHFFRVVDERFYIPNDELISRLQTALDKLPCGYIFIEGKPGIGKSTALTKFGEVNPHITLTYYCFIPDAQANFGEFRHKSHYFRKSLCIAIEKQFPEVDLPMRYSDQFEEKLSAYINKLGTLKQKIVFIIDGLDHVHRGTTVESESLLPQIKGSLPQGIYFILSSQYKAVLTPLVAAQISAEPDRHIILTAFTQPDIDRYLGSKGLVLREWLDLIEQKSQGIPLYLHYISELLSKVQHKEYGDFLEDVPALVNGEINSYHEILYQSISTDELARWLLALLAYRREDSTTETIQLLLRLAGQDCTIANVADIVSRYSHLLRQKHGRAYTIFHNSFREFILQKAPDLKDTFNVALVAYYEQVPHSDEAYRNYFRHLMETGQFEKIISATTIDWMKQAWRDLRSLDEIKENISLALDACVQTTSLSEFIRIGFLKAQFDSLTWNLKNSSLDFPLMLLKAGETGNSVRMIWDGDFVLVGKSYFSNYLGQYLLETGNLLEAEIIQQGLNKSISKQDEEAIVTAIQARALVNEDINEIFAKLDEEKWVHTNPHKSDYVLQPFSEEENTTINFGIKQKVIEYLKAHRQFEKLNILLKASAADEKLKIAVQTALVQLLIGSDKLSALQLLSSIDFSKLNDKQFIDLFGICSDYLTEPEIRQYFSERPLPLPTLQEKVIQDHHMPYRIHKDVLDLFTTLKPLLIYKPDEVNSLRLRASVLPDMSRKLYESIFYLVDLWHEATKSNLHEPLILHQAQQSLKCLYWSKKKEFRTREYGLFDMNSDQSFIARDIRHLYNQSFALYTRLLSFTGMEKLVDYWLQLEQTQDGFIHYTVALTIAERFHQGNFNLSELVFKVLRHAEAIVADEADTSSRVLYLSNIAEAYGACDFREDFRRLYNQIPEMAFGIAHRKDYQASYITTPLEQYHKTNPVGTPERLAQVLHVQQKLANAGNARMHHICLSHLIAFAANHYPALALELLEKEEKSLGREEAVEIIFTPLIKQSAKEHLPLLLAIIKTLPRWVRKPSDENHFTDLALELLNRALELQARDIIGNIIEVVRFNLIVELNTPEPLTKFAEALNTGAIDPARYGLSLQQKAESVDKINSKKQKREQDRKFLSPVETPTFDTLRFLLEEDYTKFDAYLKSIYAVLRQNYVLTALRSEYRRSKQPFEAFYQSLPAAVQQSAGIRLIIKSYVNFKNRLASLHLDVAVTFSEIEELFDKFIEEAGKAFPVGTLENFVETGFNTEAWLNNLLQTIDDPHNHLLSILVLDENTIKLVETVSILQADALLQFIHSWTSGRLQATAILIVANRLLPLNRDKAKSLLLEVAKQKKYDLVFPRYDDKEALPFDVVEAIIRIDKNFGRRFILQTYLSQQGEYGDNFISNLGKLLKYAHHFKEQNIERVYFEANLSYNQELAQGLPEFNSDYAFVAAYKPENDFTDAAIRHLMWLFNYPMVQVRQITLQAVFDLLTNNATYLQMFIPYTANKGDDNQIEHALIVLIAISKCKPQLLFPFKKDLLALTGRPHFNILESVRELLLHLTSESRYFFTATEVNLINQLNTPNLILTNKQQVYSQLGKPFLYLKYQTELIHRLAQAEDDDTTFADEVYRDLAAKGWENWDYEKEGAVHRNYNANTNFETIEIQSPYYDAVKSSMNRVFHLKICQGKYTIETIDNFRRDFRLYDPSKLLYAVRPKPDYINWLPPKLTEKAFLKFTNAEKLVIQLAHREAEYITLAEYGSQRNDEHYNELKATTYFQAFAFLKKENSSKKINKGRKSHFPFLETHNLYAFELPKGRMLSGSFPIQGIQPLLEVSNNRFRGEKDLVNTNLLSDVFDELGLAHQNLLELLQTDSAQPLKAFRWQEAYTSGSNHRRYKTISSGFTLKIKKEVLVEYLHKHHLTLCYDVIIKRSTDKHRPESYMDWYEFKRFFEIDL